MKRSYPDASDVAAARRSRQGVYACAGALAAVAVWVLVRSLTGPPGGVDAGVGGALATLAVAALVTLFARYVLVVPALVPPWEARDLRLSGREQEVPAALWSDWAKHGDLAQVVDRQTGSWWAVEVRRVRRTLRLRPLAPVELAEPGTWLMVDRWGFVLVCRRFGGRFRAQRAPGPLLLLPYAHADAVGDAEWEEIVAAFRAPSATARQTGRWNQAGETSA